jgi:hypothetical protein
VARWQLLVLWIAWMALLLVLFLVMRYLEL